MNIVYARQPLPKPHDGDIVCNSIFLAGPTPREKEYVLGWRPEALEILSNLGFSGTVLVPEDEDWGLQDFVHSEQVRWEWEGLKTAACVLFWVPRDLHLTPTGKLKMPAFTTNVEWGKCIVKIPERMVLGYPPGTPNMGYFRQDAEEYCQPLSIPVLSNLEETLKAAMLIAAK